MTPDANPFLSTSTLPYRLPPFREIREEHYAPAFEQGMAEHLAEVAAIADEPEPPTFENTIEALERSGELLDRVSTVFFNQASSDATPGVQEIQKDITPKLAKHADAVHLNAKLFARIQAVEAADEEQRRLLDRYLTDFTRAGAVLDREDQERLRRLNERLSTLATTFQQNLLADTNARAVVVDDVSELDGLSADAVQGLRETAKERGLDGKYLVTLVLPTSQPYLTELTDRSLRQRIHEASTGRGAANAELITEIAALRQERASLLGYQNHAEYVLADQTAKTTQAVTDMLDRLVPPTVSNARKEQSDLEEIAGHAV